MSLNATVEPSFLRLYKDLRTCHALTDMVQVIKGEIILKMTQRETKIA